MKVIFYTAIFGGRDNLHPASTMDSKCDYICFSDKSYDVPPWQVTVLKSEIGARLEAKFYKINSHDAIPQADISIWVDGNISPRINIDQVLDILGDNDLVIYRHPQRDCVYSEGQECIKRGLDSPEVIKKQLDRYRSEGYPEHYGLYCGGMIIRRHTKEIQEFNKLWWDEIINNSIRDQISLPYCLWKYSVKYKVIEADKIINWYVKYKHLHTHRFHERLISSVV
jgi:hypothetical protein